MIFKTTAIIVFFKTLNYKNVPRKSIYVHNLNSNNKKKYYFHSIRQISVIKTSIFQTDIRLLYTNFSYPTLFYP